MKTSLKLLTALFIGSIAGTVSADTITGQIDLAKAGGVDVNFGTNTVSFTGSPNAIVNAATGDYSVFAPVNLSYTGANYVNFSYAIGPVNPGLILWTIDTLGSDASFTLLAITGFTETANGLVISGTGLANLTGFDETTGSWSFSADRATSTAAFNFSSTNISPLAVPDGGTTALLLGLGLIGASFVARRNKVA